jgi:hypothetical protein
MPASTIFSLAILELPPPAEAFQRGGDATFHSKSKANNARVRLAAAAVATRALAGVWG